MKKYLSSLLALVILLIPIQGSANEWREKINNFKVPAFKVQNEALHHKTVDEIAYELGKQYDNYLKKITETYQKSTGVDYSPFISKWQNEQVKKYIKEHLEFTPSVISAIEDRINRDTIKAFDFFKEYDFGMSLHKIYTLSSEVELLSEKLNLQKSSLSNIVEVNQRIDSLHKDQNLLNQIFGGVICILFGLTVFSFRKKKSS